MLAALDAATATVDPVTFEVLSHRLYQITKEVGTTLERVGGTVNTTQRHDYISALYRANGDILAAGDGLPWHVACASFAVKRIIERFAGDEGIEPDDMFLLNDPYVAAIHQSDVYIICPIHYASRLVAWSATFVHVTDIGAMSPGGNSPGATEICHEGLRIPGIKLIERGKLRRDVFDAIINMTRQPALVGLDLKCEIAANNVARARIQEMCAQYGADLVDTVSGEMIRCSERVLRGRLREIPDGCWHASGVIETTEQWKVVAALTKSGDHLLFDYTGTDPQARVGINFPYHATLGACFDALLTLLAWDIPKNHGALAPIEVVAPPGTIANAQPPAPVSLNTTAGGQAIKYVADACLTQMVAASGRWRMEVMAKNMGHRRARHAGVNQHGWYYVGSVGGLDGGGARAQSDGIDTGGSGLLTDHNVEWFESQYPFLYLFRRHITDGAGAGRFRGGVGEEVALTVHDAPEGRVRGVAYGVAGLRNSGRGLFGGYPGAPSILVLYQGTRVKDLLADNVPPVELAALGGEAVPLPYSEFEMGDREVLFVVNSSGGGYGDPLDRDPSLVARDVLHGVLSGAFAREVYGVVMDGGDLDLTATAVARARLRAERRQDLDRRGKPFARPESEVDRTAGRTEHPLRENLTIATHAGHGWVHCCKCQQPLCPEGEDWAQACDRKLLPPSRAGALMEPLVGHFLLEQLYCPTCATLLETDVLEV